MCWVIDFLFLCVVLCWFCGMGMGKEEVDRHMLHAAQGKSLVCDAALWGGWVVGVSGAGWGCVHACGICRWGLTRICQCECAV